MKLIDISGSKFHRWTVIEKAEGKSMWRCVCDCDNKTEKIVNSYNLRNGKSKSCGCLKEEKTKNGDMRRTHGKRSTRIYSTWLNLRNRCYYENSDQYHNYGGRGITVCEEWRNSDCFVNFYNWAIENGYKEGLSIDRIDSNGNYEPDNCRWITMKEQSNNKRNNNNIEINGITKTISQWEDDNNLPKGIVGNRIREGWEGEKLLIQPQRKAERKSGEKGITWTKSKEKWAVEIKGVYIGRFSNIDDAIKAKYDYLNNLN